MDLFYALDCNSTGQKIANTAEYANHLRANHLTPLSALQPTDRMASMLVVVSSLTPVRKSNNGMDYFLSLRIVDPTIYPANPTGGSNSLAITIFKPSIDEFPQINGPGDIMYLDNVHVNNFQNKITLGAKRECRWNVIKTNQSIDIMLHPIVKYIRQWWQQCGIQDISYGNVTSPVGASIIAHPLTSANQAPSPAGPTINHKYLRTVSEIRIDMYPDLLLEILSVDPPQNNIQRCLATDYTQNPNLVNDHHSTVSGRRVIACEFHEINLIPKMPIIAAGKIYRLRHVHIVRDSEWGMCVNVSRDQKFPRTLVVVEVSPYSEQLKELFQRKNASKEPAEVVVVVGQNNRNLVMGDRVDGSENFQSLARRESNAGQVVVDKEEKEARRTPVVSIAQMSVRFRIKANVIRRQPSEPWETLDTKNQQLTSKFILELSQDDGKCLAVFLANTSQMLRKMLRLPPMETSGGGFERTKIIKRIEKLYALQHVELVVASFIVPFGPGGALARCLLITDILSEF
ncbi:hypothetical protein GGF40_000724 [Coemansia sp. RSA 1286]|nr:hypothetical protein GGF39_000687 [Coemansia sp. RSA 1721]KAJ2639610.1 hypothetical protein GGF40_000724 [Coemansia sp. RSA 1286]